MKKSGILHPGIAHLLASTGHTDYFTISDKGFPVSDETERIDLALIEGIPTVLDVVSAIHAEWTIDRIIVANEADLASPDWVAQLEALVGPDVPVQRMSHLELKRLSATGTATIRTGETVPYANIIVVSG